MYFCVFTATLSQSFHDLGFENLECCPLLLMRWRLSQLHCLRKNGYYSEMWIFPGAKLLNYRTNSNSFFAIILSLVECVRQIQSLLTCPYALIRTKPSLSCSKEIYMFWGPNTLSFDIYRCVLSLFWVMITGKSSFLNLAVFCRFHSLEEFDEGKRSCRKRLDGHNRRRRKPQPEPLSRSGSFLSNYQG